MSDNEFGMSVATDFAPEGSLCEWCGKPAVEQLTVIGGKNHNEGGYFCHACGEKFIRAVADPDSRVVSAEASAEREALTERFWLRGVAAGGFRAGENFKGGGKGEF